LKRIDVGRAAQAACVLEAVSAKPGNVNRHLDFADTTLADFLLSAVMIGRSMDEADRNPVGETILNGVQATKRVVACNTNLGILLLFAPLAKAYVGGDLRTSLRGILESLTVDDAASVCRAIRLAAPGGLGNVAVQDVAGDPDVTLLELMGMARARDSVASEYASGYAITFELACPALECHLKQHGDFSSAIVHAYLTVLAEVPDTLIARKKGLKDAQEVSCMATKILRSGGMKSDSGREQLREFDAFLRSEGNSLNPGTTADLVAVAVFTYFLQHGLDALRSLRV
jgi:triphosphoribosyl-dephospho-CoA synthase